MQEENNTPIEGQPAGVEMTDDSRREFITKLVAAGAIAAAGFLASAEAAPRDVAPPEGADSRLGKIEGQLHKGDIQMGKIDGQAIKLHKETLGLGALKFRNGFRLALQGQALGAALQQAGLLAPDARLENATLTIEFSA